MIASGEIARNSLRASQLPSDSRPIVAYHDSNKPYFIRTCPGKLAGKRVVILVDACFGWERFLGHAFEFLRCVPGHAALDDC